MYPFQITAILFCRIVILKHDLHVRMIEFTLCVEHIRGLRNDG